jgi:hypothetical protein
MSLRSAVRWIKLQSLRLPLTVRALWLIGTCATYLLCLANTWREPWPVWIRLVMSGSVDVAVAVFWPIAWITWAIFAGLGIDSPLTYWITN